MDNEVVGTICIIYTMMSILLTFLLADNRNEAIFIIILWPLVLVISIIRGFESYIMKD